MNEVEDIKERLDIVDLISSYITMKKAGRNYKANCPFHKEKTPSFMVSPEKQIWHCFGCQKGGDAFGFIMEMEGMDFPEALRFLGKKAGVPIKEFSPQSSGKKNLLFELNDLAVSFYHKVLTDSREAKFVRDYLEKRGLSDDTVMEFKLGYSPEGFTNLSDFLKKKGYKEEDIIKAGLALKKDNGRVVDRFYKRLMFPIANPSGGVLGFTARVLTNDKVAKYINTPETQIYEKSRVLFGIDKAKRAISEKGWLVVVEGNMDVLSSFQAGVKNVVASSGTALTQEQLKAVKRYTSNIIMALDKDEAGLEALKRGVFLALEESMNIKIVDMGNCKDPDEMIKKDKNEWKRTLKNSKPFMDFYIDQFFAKIDGQLDVTQKKRIARDALPFIKRIQNNIEKTHYIQILAKKLNVPESSIQDALAKTKADKKISEKKEESIVKKDAETLLSETLLSLMLAFSASTKEIISLLNEKDFSDDEARNIFLNIKKQSVQGLVVKSDEFPQDLQSKVSELIFVAEESNEGNNQDSIFQEAKFCYKRLKEFGLRKQKEDLKFLIEEAEKSKDSEKTKKLAGQFQELLVKEQKIKEF